MAVKPNPATHLHHATEKFRSRSRALARWSQLKAAGFGAYVVDMHGVNKAAERFALHITEGKRNDLSQLPKAKR